MRLAECLWLVEIPTRTVDYIRVPVYMLCYLLTYWNVLDASDLCGNWERFDITKCYVTGKYREIPRKALKKVMYESLPDSRKSRNGRKMARQFVPDIWCNGWKLFGLCHCGFPCWNTYWQERRSKWSIWYAALKGCGKNHKLKVQHLEIDSS